MLIYIQKSTHNEKNCDGLIENNYYIPFIYIKKMKKYFNSTKSSA